MDIAGVQKGLVGMALFDMWANSVRKAGHARRAQGSPTVAAACDAFDAYVQSVEVGNAAMIAGLATYALNPGGTSVNLINNSELAPFLAMNLVA